MRTLFLSRVIIAIAFALSARVDATPTFGKVFKEYQTQAHGSGSERKPLRPLILQSNFEVDGGEKLPTRLFGLAGAKEPLSLIFAIKIGALAVDSGNPAGQRGTISEWDFDPAGIPAVDQKGVVELSLPLVADDQGRWLWEGTLTVPRAKGIDRREFVPGSALFSVTIRSDAGEDTISDVLAGDVWLFFGGAELSIADSVGGDSQTYEVISRPPVQGQLAGRRSILGQEFVNHWRTPERPVLLYILTGDSETGPLLEIEPWNALKRDGSELPTVRGAIWSGGAFRAEYWDTVSHLTPEEKRKIGDHPTFCKDKAEKYSEALVSQDGTSGLLPGIRKAFCKDDEAHLKAFAIVVAQLPSAGAEPAGLREFPWGKASDDSREGKAWSEYWPPYSSWALYRKAQSDAVARLKAGGRARLVPMLSDSSATLIDLPAHWIWSENGTVPFAAAAKRLVENATQAITDNARMIDFSKLKTVRNGADLILTVETAVEMEWSPGISENFEVDDNNGWKRVKPIAEKASKSPAIRFQGISERAKSIRYAWRDAPGRLCVLRDVPVIGPAQQPVIVPPFQIKID